jgi:mono/diheme cytochrome c family protein
MTWSCVLSAVAVISLVGCGNDSGYGLYPDGSGPDGDVDLPAGPGEIPCDVYAILADRCQTCHGATPANGAPFPLVTYRDLTKNNTAGVAIAQRVLARIKAATSPMPPKPGEPLTAAEIALFEAWVTADTPTSKVDCKVAPGPFDGPLVCTSGTTWPGGDRGAPIMHPGLACIACHANVRDDIAPVVPKDDDAPRFVVAGTVYPTGHEPNNCNGASAGTVEVTDSTGKVTALPVNAAGNFFTTASLPFPIHVAVAANGKRRAMVASPPRGDCNSCHTPDGANGAPGRITLP